MDSAVIIVFATALIIGGIMIAFMTYSKGGKKHLKVEKYRVKWLVIEQQLGKDEPSSHSLCILNADKLLDQALKERGYSGNTMGERMISAKTTWTNADHIWTAHKLRNQIAHEPDFKPNYETAKRALAAFKQALKDVGAI
jgi:hypothetical protein